MPHWDFACPEPVDVHVHVLSGTVKIIAEPTELITVDLEPGRPSRRYDLPEVRVEFANGRLEVVEQDPVGLLLRHGGSIELTVAVPVGSRCDVDTLSADIECQGELGSLQAKTASGAVQAEAVEGPAEVTTISGRITIGHVADQANAKTASGRIQFGHVGGDLSAGSVSGRVRVDAADASVKIHTASGRVQAGNLRRGSADISTVSGAIEVNVTPGTAVYLDLSSLTGQVSSDLDNYSGDRQDEVDLNLRCRSTSGSLRVGRAQLADVTG
jgi:DUF4097 and DUF4098 domain-containing protein YvlB